MAAKRKRKRGNREPNGRLSRRKGDVQARGLKLQALNKETVLDARARHQGIKITDADNVDRSTVFGWMFIMNLITRNQYETGKDWDVLRRRYSQIIGSAALLPRSSSDHNPRGGMAPDPDDEGQVEEYRAISKRYKAARRAILESGRFGHMAVQSFIDDNIYVPSLLGDLRLALNALNKTFGRD